MEVVLEKHELRTLEKIAENRKKRAEMTGEEGFNPYEALFETKSGEYYIARLLNMPHLEEESDFMKHCVGTSSSYINKMNKGDIEILSFRDKEGNPLVTIEYNLKTGDIEQIKKESDKYLNFDDPYYEEFIQSLERMQETSTNYDSPESTESTKRKIRKVNTSELGNLNLDKNFIATGRGNISIYDFDKENDFILKMGEIGDEISDELFTDLMNKKNGMDYEVGEIAKNPEDITENTKYFDGDLDESHIDILKNII
ncbi:MAG TPA: hypothetical protein EYG72_01470, partial [Candidatus Pacebacteria bacterium]|nr:hypothetical protein [Candidatus Paceibacterota bacterium]